MSKRKGSENMKDEEIQNESERTLGDRIKNGFLDLLLVACLVVAGCCGYYIYRKLREYKIEEDYVADIQDDYGDDEDDPLKRVIDFDSLLARNEDVVGWLYIPGTSIDEPVMMGSKSNYYLHRNLDREYMYAGQLFLDYRNTGEFTEDSSIIYGHNMRNGTKFHDLRYFLEKDKFDSMRAVYLYLPDGTVNVYRTFSSLKVKSGSSFYAVSIDDYDKFLNKIRGAATVFYDEKEEMEDDAPLLMLSTCYGSGNDWRTVVYGYLQANVLVKG